MTITRTTGRRALIRKIIRAIGYYKETRERHMEVKAKEVLRAQWPLRNTVIDYLT